MSLKIIKALKKEVSVKNLIHERLAGWEPARNHETIHASDLMKDQEFCPREWALRDLGVTKIKDQFVGTALRMTFDFGRDVETRIRNQYLRDIAVGYWKCGVCGYQHQVLCKAPKHKCPECGWGHKWEYDEVRVHSPISGVSGGIDTLLDTSGTKLTLVEIKTLDKDEHRKLLAPFAEHRFRTSLYLRLAAESDQEISGRIDTSEAKIIYVSKSFGFKDTTLAEDGIKDSAFSPIKEFTIKRDDKLSDNLLARAQVVSHWRDSEKKGMPCGICPNGLQKRAQQCSAVASCWSGAYPSTLTWRENGNVQHPGKKIVGG